MDSVHRTKSGIPGFDEIIEGGFPTGTSVLLSGTAGAGKTIFGIQFLVNGIKQFNENGIFVSFEERPKDLRSEMDNFGWNLRDYEERKQLAIIDVASARDGIRSGEQYLVDTSSRALNVTNLATQIFALSNELKASRVVIDSIPSLELRLIDVTEVRRAVSQLTNLLLEMNVTSLIVTEIANPFEFSRYGFEEYVTRGLITMKMISQYGELRRTIQVVKMRGTNHSTRTFPFEILENGIEVQTLRKI